jgi:hypothetical protein
MYFIENKYGNNGYATWYKILEKLGSTEYHYLNLNREDEVMFLAAKCKVSEELLLSIINDLSKMDVFHKELWDNKIVWCPQFIESIEDAYKKRNNKCITLDSLGILLEGLGILKQSKSTSKGHGNPQRREENSIEEKRKEYIDVLFLDSVNKWMKYKTERKESYKSKTSEISFYNSLLKLSNNNPSIAELIIEQSMANNWAGIFKLKSKPVDNTKKEYKLYSAQGPHTFFLNETELAEKKLNGYWKEQHEI